MQGWGKLVATVLIVDDNAVNRAMMLRVLEQHGYRAIEAANGAEAIGLARVRAPDVIITDVLMPKVDGYELERELRSDPCTATIPVVFHTGAYSRDELAGLVTDEGRVRLLPKPAGVDDLLEAVASALAERPQVVGAAARDRQQEHLDLITEKLLQKVRELEVADRQRQELVTHLIQVQETERAAIAGDIHDDSVQAMTAVAMRLEMMGGHLTDPDLVERHRVLEQTVRVAIGRLRRLLFQLHPPVLERDGLAAAITAHLDHLVDRQTCQAIVVDEMDTEPRASLRILLFRVVQEALTNIMKHAEASAIHVELRSRDGGYAIEVRDDGRGFQPDATATRPGHVGLVSMQQRVALTGGVLSLDSAPGRGTVVQAWVPAGHEEDGDG